MVFISSVFPNSFRTLGRAHDGVADMTFTANDMVGHVANDLDAEGDGDVWSAHSVGRGSFVAFRFSGIEKRKNKKRELTWQISFLRWTTRRTTCARGYRQTVTAFLSVSHCLLVLLRLFLGHCFSCTPMSRSQTGQRLTGTDKHSTPSSLFDHRRQPLNNNHVDREKRRCGHYEEGPSGGWRPRGRCVSEQTKIQFHLSLLKKTKRKFCSVTQHVPESHSPPRRVTTRTWMETNCIRMRWG